MAATGIVRAARTAGSATAGLRVEREDRSAKENLQQDADRISIPALNQINRFQSIMPVSNNNPVLLGDQILLVEVGGHSIPPYLSIP